MDRSSRPDVFCKTSVLKNLSKFIAKNLRQSFFFNKVADLRSATLLKKRFWYRCLPVNFAKFLRTPFLKEHLRWLLLDGEFPDYWKKANVVLAHEKENLVKNYRLISILPISGKVFERVIFKHLFNYFHENELFI